MKPKGQQKMSSFMKMRVLRRDSKDETRKLAVKVKIDRENNWVCALKIYYNYTSTHGVLHNQKKHFSHTTAAGGGCSLQALTRDTSPTWQSQHYTNPQAQNTLLSFPIVVYLLLTFFVMQMRKIHSSNQLIDLFMCVFFLCNPE